MRYWAEVNSENEVVFVHQLDMDDPYEVYSTDNRLIESFPSNSTNDGILAGIGCIYIEELNIFLPPKRYPSWIVNKDTGRYEAPVEHPDLNSPYDYQWSEEVGTWIFTGKHPKPVAGPIILNQ